MLPQSILRCLQRNPPRLKIPECDGAGLDCLSLSQRHGALINKKGGYYCAGKQYASFLAETKTATRTTRLAAATKCPKRVGSFGYSTLASEEKASEK